MLDISRLCEIARNSYCYYNTPIIIDEQTFQIPIIFTGRNGIYIFVEEIEEVIRNSNKAEESAMRYVDSLVEAEDEKRKEYIK